MPASRENAAISRYVGCPERFDGSQFRQDEVLIEVCAVNDNSSSRGARIIQFGELQWLFRVLQRSRAR